MDYGGNYTATSYGAQGGAGGGGFMAGSQGGSQPNALRGTISRDTLRPCTIKQIVDASQPHPDADFKIDDVEVQQITFVGQIRNISTQTTNITYKLDDGTGTVEVKQWIDAENDPMDNARGGQAKTSGLVENEWARVWGRLKAFNNRRHVGAHVMRPVADKMDITFHLLEATYVHLYFTRGPLESKDGVGTGLHRQLDGARENGDVKMEGSTGGERPLPNISANARRVLQCLKESPQNNEGLHNQHIAASLRMPVIDVVNAGDELLTHSLIFTTVDDNTWAVLEF
ncbi:MAG: hypothetical protein Q9222_002340 [Ikaeria aurantiellina]